MQRDSGVPGTVVSGVTVPKNEHLLPDSLQDRRTQKGSEGELSGVEAVRTPGGGVDAQLRALRVKVGGRGGLFRASRRPGARPLLGSLHVSLSGTLRPGDESA